MYGDVCLCCVCVVCVCDVCVLCVVCVCVSQRLSVVIREATVTSN